MKEKADIFLLAKVLNLIPIRRFSINKLEDFLNISIQLFYRIFVGINVELAELL